MYSVWLDVPNEQFDPDLPYLWLARMYAKDLSCRNKDTKVEIWNTDTHQLVETYINGKKVTPAG